MSYEGAGSGYRGFGFYGGLGDLGETYSINWTRGDVGVRQLQQELQRLGFLGPGTGEFGADGKWGPRTEMALRSAARYVGWEEGSYTAAYANQRHSAGTVEVPDELIVRLREAQPAPAGTPGARYADEPEEEPILIGPHLDPPAVPSNGGGGTGWLPAALIGVGVIGAGAYIVYKMRPPKPRITANRRRRRRRRR